jgi:hypothetical protein
MSRWWKRVAQRVPAPEIVKCGRAGFGMLE